jgi:hypothetical protein
VPLLFDPGTGWEYGIGIDLAGKVVEAVTGKTLETYFRQMSEYAQHFAALNAAVIEFAHLIIGECRAAGPDFNHKTHDRVAMRIGHPFGNASRRL